jgi:hypothetical protein
LGSAPGKEDGDGGSVGGEEDASCAAGLQDIEGFGDAGDGAAVEVDRRQMRARGRRGAGRVRLRKGKERVRQGSITSL